MLERYELVRLLGRGAAGDVYLARDRLLGNRELALKRIAARVDDSLRKAFEREFSTMASLSLPGVAQVYDFGVARTGGAEERRAFYTRAYIDGRPLDQAAALVGSRERIRLFTLVARVVSPLHRIGVVHGDLKPGNAIIDTDGAAHVIDFGLARVLGGGRSEELAGGTLPFMAPELLRGEAPTVQSDVFALGATLWQLLTGDFPFGRRGCLGTDARRAPELPDGLDEVARHALQVALRTLAIDPFDRLPTVDELLAALGEGTPGSSNESQRSIFVPPRPRGHRELLDRVQAAALGDDRSGTILVTAPEGGGKSLLLRELKWRLQIRGVQVFELSASAGEVAAPLRALLRQLEVAVAGNSEGAAAVASGAAALEAGRVDGAELSDALAAAFAAARKSGPAALLADDLDAAEGTLGSVLRSALFTDARGAIAIVATASDCEAPAVRRLSSGERFEIPALPRIEQQALVTEAHGAVDASVLDALYEYTQGLPAALMNALAALHALAAPTVADVRALPPASASLALAQARLGRAPQAAKEALRLFSLLGRVADARLLSGLTADGPNALERLVGLLAACEEVGLLDRRADGVGLADVALEKALLAELGADGCRELATAVLRRPGIDLVPLPQRARLAVLARDAVQVQALVPRAGVQLVATGAHGAAAELYEAQLASAEGDAHDRALLSLARCRQALGELELAAELARRLLEKAELGAELRADTAVVSAQALTALGRFEEAVSTLSLVGGDAVDDVRARVQRELAKVHLRRGDYDAVREAAEAGLACVKDPVLRSELLCARGVVASYRAEHDLARGYLEQAVAIAREAGAAREEANALATLAIGCFRTGELLVARDLFAQCLEIARRLGDVGSMANFAQNLGGILFCLGEPAAAAEHYESAVRLANRAGRQSTQAQARANLAHLHIYFGLYERARGELHEVAQYAQAAGQKYLRAQTSALFGDLAARAGDVDQALIHFDDAIARYRELGHTREVAEHHLDAAEVLMDRGGPADASAVVPRLAAAREFVEREKLADLGQRLALLLSRARLLAGEAEAALSGLESVIEGARKARNRDLEWRALAASGDAHEALGAEFAARRSRRMAVEVLEDIALRIPREHREAFWHDPRRRAARERAMAAEESSFRSATTSAPSSDLSTLIGDERAARLLDIIKRLASEHDLDRLLQRITESAVDLSGAERGYVLLVDRNGQLEKRTMEFGKAEQRDPHAAFSRSIAEAVLVDGEPIVTVDATVDGRLSEYVSVHKLMLRSVACLPIRGHAGTVGVLYLEHNRSRGRFSASAVALLHAFADQAAIALENTRLMLENANRQKELEAANKNLERAKQDLEDLLSARTDALIDAQRELTRARRSARSRATRHGMVGQCAGMLRVFDTIDRIHSAKVPVIVHGESGTGKELVARAIHEAGVRSRGPFVAINCGSLPESLLESELFGHVEGAFSGAERDRRGLIARASGGTLFLDEVADMPPRMQVDLLRVLQEGAVCKVGAEQDEKVDVRFIAASHRRLDELVAAGKFREDLFYRLNVVEISLPALRDRREDIPLLCEHFLQCFADRDGVPGKRLSRAALDKLVGHPFPGNVRQLEHVLLQAWVMTDGPIIDEEDLALDAEHGSRPPEPVAADPTPIENYDEFQKAERRKILSALEAHGWNRARAAKALGMPRRTFYRRLQEHQIL